MPPPSPRSPPRARPRRAGAPHLRVRHRVDEELGPQEERQLAEVHLGHEHLRVAPQDVARVAREGVEVVEVRLRDVDAPLARPPDGRPDRAVGRAPAEHEQLRVPVRDRRPRAPGCPPRCPRPSARAAAPCGRGCRGRTRSLPVTSAFSSPPIRCSRPGVPGIAHGRASVYGVAQVRLERRRRSPRANVGRDVGERADVGDQPGLGAVRQIGVGEQVDRRPVLERDARRLDRRVEALRRRRRGDDRHGALAVPAEEHHQQVGLLRLRRHPGRGACALDVEDQERQLERDREADGLRLERRCPGRPMRSRRAPRRTRRRRPRRPRRSRPRPGR